MSHSRTPMPEPGMTLPKDLNIVGFSMGDIIKPFENRAKDNDHWVAGIHIHYKNSTHYNGIEVYAVSEPHVTLLRQRLFALIADGHGIFNISE